ncbi:aminoacyl-tRNA deacylase [Leucobacter aridicollis]|uniref:aminoacyl-tRNA deacylase n=1 Tax=Leucobacter aridicollis TaxID=283878 RepID=UPI000E64D25C|nr:YbaK/EbsC family protein [Leucobacter aridicollis]UTX52385.1 YbaK/EbsC family protein [Leucobacter aridicollis]
MTHAAGTETDVPSEVYRAASDAAARGLAVEFVVRDGTGRPTRADFGGAQIVKSVVVQRGEGFVFVLTPLDGQFSWAKLRAHLGVNRLSLPDADAAYAATGYKRGTITPLGSSTAWPVIIDESLSGQTVVVGAGSPGIGALVRTDELAQAYDADLVQLTGAGTE